MIIVKFWGQSIEFIYILLSRCWPESNYREQENALSWASHQAWTIWRSMSKVLSWWPSNNITRWERIKYRSLRVISTDPEVLVVMWLLNSTLGRQTNVQVSLWVRQNLPLSFTAKGLSHIQEPFLEHPLTRIGLQRLKMQFKSPLRRASKLCSRSK